MLLRNRSRAVTSRQAALMTDQTPPISSRFFTKNLYDVEAIVMSPTSILDTKNFSTPFGYSKNLSPKPSRSEPEAVGLALIDSFDEEKHDGNFSKPISRMVLFGSKLKVQIPKVMNHNISGNPCLQSPVEFGIKTRVRDLSPFCEGEFSCREMSLKEMELCEDYTCVITHGSNPKTTHIFGNCIVERCCREDVKDCHDSVETSASMDFLSFCHTCNSSLGEGKDIYMYRGEKAFCSHECRCQEMLFENTETMEDAF